MYRSKATHTKYEMRIHLSPNAHMLISLSRSVTSKPTSTKSHKTPQLTQVTKVYKLIQDKHSTHVNHKSTNIAQSIDHISATSTPLQAYKHPNMQTSHPKQASNSHRNPCLPALKCNYPYNKPETNKHQHNQYSNSMHPTCLLKDNHNHSQCTPTLLKETPNTEVPQIQIPIIPCESYQIKVS
eukprot:gene3141-2123_t